jgi:hypothetical protein
MTGDAVWVFGNGRERLDMKLEVKRQWFTNSSTVGELFVDGVHFCYTLEPPTRDDEIKPRAIPVGTYDVRIGWSPTHHRLIPMVGGVPGFTGVEIHIGNYPRDTEGCLLVGRTKDEDEVGESTPTFCRLFSLLSEAEARAEEITISYSAEAVEPADAIALQLSSTPGVPSNRG